MMAATNCTPELKSVESEAEAQNVVGSAGEAPTTETQGVGSAGEAPTTETQGVGSAGEAPTTETQGVGSAGETPTTLFSLGRLGYETLTSVRAARSL